MFGNSKEYQDLQKLYVDGVSKPENIDEFFGLGKKKKEKNKEVNITPLSDRDKSDIKKEKDIENYDKNKIKEIEAKAEKNKTKGIGPVVDNPDTPDTDEKKEYGKKLNQIKANKEAEANKKREQDKKTDTSNEIESDAKYAQSNKNMNRINKFGKSSVPKPVKSPMETGMGDGAAKARAIAKARIRSGKTIADVKASNTQSMKDAARARNDAFKAKRASRNLDKQLDFDDPAKGNFGLSNSRGKSVKKLGKPQPKVKSPMDMRNESLKSISNDMAEIYKNMYNQPVEPNDLDEGKVAKAVGKLVGKTIKKIGDTMVVKGGRKVKVATKGAPSADYSRKTFLQSQKEKLAAQKAKGKVAPDKFKEKGFDIKPVAGGGGTTIQRVNKYGIQPGIEPGTKAAKQTGKLKVDSTKGKTPTKRTSFQDKDFKPKYENYEPYDIVLEYLLTSQQAATIEEANYIMTEMDAKTIQDIVSQQLNEQN